MVLLMSFYFPVALMELAELCGAGEWRPRAAAGIPQLLPCAPCPVGMQCSGVDLPEACPENRVALMPGAARCCPADARCGEGSAVTRECGCEPIACEEASLVRVGDGELQCQPVATCERCGEGYALEVGCACVKVKDGWWRAAQSRFVRLLDTPFF